MLSNTVTLAVDAANVGSPSNEDYTRFDEYQNRSIYIGANHAPDDRDMLGFYRTFPTKSGNFKGVSKTSVKLTRDMEVPGVDSSTTLTSPIIIEATFSVPVGVTSAELIHARQRLVAALDDDSLMNALNIQQMI